MAEFQTFYKGKKMVNKCLACSTEVDTLKQYFAQYELLRG